MYNFTLSSLRKITAFVIMIRIISILYKHKKSMYYKNEFLYIFLGIMKWNNNDEN